MKKIFLLTIATVIFVLATRLFVTLYLADVSNSSAQDLVAQGETTTALVEATNAIEQNAMEPLYYRTRAKVWIAQLATANPDQVKLIKKFALNDLQAAYRLNPKNLATLRNEVPLYFFLATQNISLPAGTANIDPEYSKFAEDFYNKVQIISPNDVGIFVLLAKYEKRLGLQKEYDSNVEIVRRLRPDLLDWNDAFK